MDAKKVANNIHKNPLTTPELNDHSVLLISFEKMIESPAIPTTAPIKIGNLMGFLKNIKPLKTVNKVRVEKIRQIKPVAR
jgi:hypothetical protein